MPSIGGGGRPTITALFGVWGLISTQAPWLPSHYAKINIWMEIIVTFSPLTGSWGPQNPIDLICILSGYPVTVIWWNREDNTWEARENPQVSQAWCLSHGAPHLSHEASHLPHDAPHLPHGAVLPYSSSSVSHPFSAQDTDSENWAVCLGETHLPLNVSESPGFSKVLGLTCQPYPGLEYLSRWLCKWALKLV